MGDHSEQVNLARLCWKLHDEFTQKGIAQICSQFGVDAKEFGLADPTPSIMSYVDLVKHINRQDRLPDLLNMMQNMGHQIEGVHLPSSDWKPRNLPQDVIEKVNGLLGVQGQEYRILDQGEYHNTGCIVWELPQKEIDPDPESVLEFLLGESEMIDQHLQTVQRALDGLTVLAYKGDLSGGFGNYSESDQIVVAATRDQFDIIRIERTEAVNYDYTTAELIRMLQDFDAEFGIDITGASAGVVEFRIAKDLKNLNLDELRQRLLEFRAETFVASDLTEEFLAGPLVLFWD